MSSKNSITYADIWLLNLLLMEVTGL